MVLGQAERSVHCVPGFFSGSDHMGLVEFLKASSALRDSYRFAHSTDLGLGLKYGVDREYVEYLLKREHVLQIM